MNGSDEFKNKRYFITGGSTGIGKETAGILSREGAKVTILSRNKVMLASAVSTFSGGGHNYFDFDLTNVPGVENKIKNIVEECGPFDGYIHCAGIAEIRPISVSNYDFMLKLMNVNFFSFFEIIRCLTKKQHYNPGFNIVGVSSVSSLQGNSAKAGYSASKAAMDAAIRCLAKELSKKNIRVNSVAPAIISSPMTDEFITSGLEMDNYNDLYKRQYLGPGTPVDVANMIVFLLSDKSRMITGSTIGVDGGRLTS